MADDQQFCLRWNEFQSNMVSSFRHLREEKSFTDVTLACDGQTCKAHKMVLSACSPYFKALLEVKLYICYCILWSIFKLHIQVKNAHFYRRLLSLQLLIYFDPMTWENVLLLWICSREVLMCWYWWQPPCFALSVFIYVENCPMPLILLFIYFFSLFGSKLQGFLIPDFYCVSGQITAIFPNHWEPNGHNEYCISSTLLNSIVYKTHCSQSLVSVFANQL